MSAPNFTVGDTVQQVQMYPGGRVGRFERSTVAKVSATKVTLTDGSAWRARDGYYWGSRPTRGVGRSFDRRIEVVGKPRSGTSNVTAYLTADAATVEPAIERARAALLPDSGYLPLSVAEPLRSLRALAGVTHRTLGELRRSQVTDAAVVKAERGGASIQLDTLAAYADALGYRVVLGVEPRAK